MRENRRRGPWLVALFCCVGGGGTVSGSFTRKYGSVFALSSTTSTEGLFHAHSPPTPRASSTSAFLSHQHAHLHEQRFWPRHRKHCPKPVCPRPSCPRPSCPHQSCNCPTPVCPQPVCPTPVYCPEPKKQLPPLPPQPPSPKNSNAGGHVTVWVPKCPGGFAPILVPNAAVRTASEVVWYLARFVQAVPRPEDPKEVDRFCRLRFVPHARLRLRFGNRVLQDEGPTLQMFGLGGRSTFDGMDETQRGKFQLPAGVAEKMFVKLVWFGD